jgi:hypothetical protein
LAYRRRILGAMLTKKVASDNENVELESEAELGRRQSDRQKPTLLADAPS